MPSAANALAPAALIGAPPASTTAPPAAERASSARRSDGDATGGQPALPSPALDLRWPPTRPLPGDAAPPSLPSPARQAVEAQVGGRPHRGPEGRMARRLETGWTAERLDDGRVRMRRGDDCVMLSPTQASQLDSWNNRGTTPRGVGSCGSD